MGTVLGGLVGEWLGLRAALVLSGVGLLAGSAPYLAVRVGRLRRIDELSPSPATP